MDYKNYFQKLLNKKSTFIVDGQIKEFKIKSDKNHTQHITDGKVVYNFVISGSRNRGTYGNGFIGFIVEIYINGHEFTRNYFEQLFNNKISIEEKLSDINLMWGQSPNDPNTYRIFTKLEAEINDETKWEEYIDWQIDTMIKFLKVFPQYTIGLKKEVNLNKEISIYDKLFNTFKNESNQIFTREQIIDKVINNYPNSNRTSIIPSDYCVNLKNKGSSEYELFEYVENAKYKVLNLVGVQKMNIKNIILYGAPGVGKTHNYKKLISLIEKGEQKEKDIFKEIETSNEKYELEDFNDDLDSRVEFVTFHQSFGYEDFIEGFRPNEEGKIKSEDGIFKNICRKASSKIILNNEFYINRIIKTDRTTYTISDITNEMIYIKKENDSKLVPFPKKLIAELLEKIKEQKITIEDIKNRNLENLNLSFDKYMYGYNSILYNVCKSIVEDIEYIEQKNFYLVIDEINRGNISKIFGELITLIEESKRDNYEVTLPYSKEKFSVPSNLFIIGTMNTTDKSIALIDVALRRRFTFIKMQPNSNLVIKSYKETFEKLNEQIKTDLGEEYQIGHSYFMNIEESDLDFVIEYKIKPLLEEYYYGDKRLIDVLDIIKYKENKN